MSALAWATAAVCSCIIMGASAVTSAIRNMAAQRTPQRLEEDQFQSLIEAINHAANEVLSLHTWLSREEHEGAFENMIEGWRIQPGENDGGRN